MGPHTFTSDFWQRLKDNSGKKELFSKYSKVARTSAKKKKKSGLCSVSCKIYKNYFKMNHIIKLVKCKT